MASSIGKAIGGIASGVGGMFGASAAGKAADSQADAAEAQMALAQAQWDRYMDAFAPLEDKMMKEAQLPATQLEGFREAKGRMNRSYADLGVNTDKSMASMFPVGGGMKKATEQSMDRSRIKDIANLESDWDQNRWNRMMGIVGYGRNLPATAQAGYSSAGNIYGQQASMYGNLAGQSGAGVGTAIANIPWNSMFGGGSFGGGYDPALGSWSMSGTPYH